MAKHPMEDNRDWKGYSAGREVKPERELLQKARAGDELAAQELLLWPQWYPRDAIDPEVYEAIVAGALDVAIFVANECKSPKGKHNNVASVKASMFFNGAKKIPSTDKGKKIERKEARIALAIANGPGDPECLSPIELRVALTREFAPMMKGMQWEDYLSTRAARQRPLLIRDAESRLIEFIRWKYSPHHDGASSSREKALNLDEEACKGLVAVSFSDIQWHRDADKPYPYPEDWK
jgi:hypothetical protein